MAPHKTCRLSARKNSAEKMGMKRTSKARMTDFFSVRKEEDSSSGAWILMFPASFFLTLVLE